MSTTPSKKSLVPKQQKGAKSDTFHAVKLRTSKEAKAFFKVAQNRLLDITNWYKLCGLGSATFALTDSKGNKVKRLAKHGDHLRIDVPAPGSKTGDGYDWVRVEAIENKKDPSNDYEELSLRARPTKNPKDNTGQTAHFFQNDATSTFMVVREKNIVRAEIHGRNELPNVKQETKLDTLRNAVMALGAMLGFSKFQWKKLVKGLVSQKEQS